MPVWPKLVEKIDGSLREADEWKSVLLDKDGKLYGCKPEDDRLNNVRRGLCETSSSVASILGVPLKTDRRIMDNTPTKSIKASFQYFGKGPTFVYDPPGIQVILREKPEADKPGLPSVRIGHMFDLTKNMKDGVNANDWTTYESIKPPNEADAVFPGVQKDVHIVYPAL